MFPNSRAVTNSFLPFEIRTLKQNVTGLDGMVCENLRAFDACGKFSTDWDLDRQADSTTPVRLNLMSLNRLVTFPQINRTLLLLLVLDINFSC